MLNIDFEKTSYDEALTMLAQHRDEVVAQPPAFEKLSKDEAKFDLAKFLTSAPVLAGLGGAGVGRAASALTGALLGGLTGTGLGLAGQHFLGGAEKDEPKPEGLFHRLTNKPEGYVPGMRLPSGWNTLGWGAGVPAAAILAARNTPGMKKLTQGVTPTGMDPKTTARAQKAFRRNMLHAQRGRGAVHSFVRRPFTEWGVRRGMIGKGYGPAAAGATSTWQRGTRGVGTLAGVLMLAEAAKRAFGGGGAGSDPYGG
jgi:hypothetical protein